MLDVINRYLHGFVAVPVILACRKKGLFELLEHQGRLTREQIVESLGANGGHLQVALRMMRSLNWLERNEVGQYSLKDEAQLHKKLPEEILDLYHLPIESYLMGEQPSGLLKNWISRSIQRWNVDDPMMADFLDGILVIPILLALHKHNFLVEDEQKPLFSQLSDSVRQELYELFTSKGWALRQEGNYYLTNVGRFIAERALIIGVTASYTPMLSRMSDVLFGDCFSVFRRDTLGQESHVERTLNVVASGFQHEKYFADVEDIILSIFNQLPIEEQPKYVVDMGCGDGTLLKRVYETIRSKSARGKVLHQYPLCAIGVDYNEASINATARTLADIPHLVFQGDIGDPEQMIDSLKSHGIHDPENILHIRSFLDHDRPFIPPQNLEQVQVRFLLPYQGVYVAQKGDLIPPHIMVQSLVEHLERWSKVVTKPGLIIGEVHCLEPDVVNRFLSHSENLHFDAIQAFSMQHLVEADVFLMAAAEVGLFPKFEFSKRYPKTFPFTGITLNCFEKRPYKIRHPHLSDLDALVNLEAKCWPEQIRASKDEIRQRIERYPFGHCVLEMDSTVVGVIYSQRIECAEQLLSTNYRKVSSLHTKTGSIIQLLAINILPEMQDRGLGDQLREFMLQLCTLKGGLERVVAVTLCKNYVSHAHIPIEEYIHQRNELGQLLDPILRFHSSSGATIKGIIPNYRPEDVDNLGNGVLIEYDIHNRLQFYSDKALKMESVPKRKIGLKENETDYDVIEECIRFVLGSRRSAAFARSLPLMEMGLDSLELLELRALMSQRLGVELEPTFFFQYGTMDAIARYFKGTEGSDVRTALPNLDEPESEGGYDSDLSSVIDNSEDLIAIIGMSCRFPGGINNHAQYWSVLLHGINAIVEVPSYRWDINHYYAPDPKQPGKISSKYGGFLEQVDQFDAPFFRISPREAAFIDPQQRILLEETWTAIENAGINPESLSGSQTGVFVGIFSHDYELLQVKSNSPDDFNAYFGTGNSASIAAGRLSYFFGFTGPALAVDTACSSSLVAVHLASQSLLRGECDLAVASGVNLLLSPELSIAFSQAGMLSSDGQCKTFDASANGYVRSEGCGVVVLKRLKKALADHDNILAVIRGTAINQDGTSSGLTAPNQRSQEAVIQKALSMAKVSPSEVSYVEAHGTGTSLGDPIEVKALEAVYGQQRDEDNPLVIGSVKTTIGHAEAAAGMAGLIKVVLSMQNQYIPPHLHFKQLNPHMTLSGIPAVIPTVGMEWKRPQSGRRLAGVSSFGFSGTNAHVVLEEAPVGARSRALFERNRHLLTISAKSDKALLELAQRYGDFFATNPESSLADVCFTANVGRTHFEYRLAVVAESNRKLRDELTAFAEGKETFRLVSGPVNSTVAPKLAFLFTGQGSQYIGMGRQLYELSPTFRQTLDCCDSIVRPYLDKPLLSVLYPEPGKTSPINETAYTQPALFALEYALHQLWQSWGIKPAAVMGHSVGEYVAATVAGVFSLEDGLKLIAARGRLMQALPCEGEMVALLASEGQVAPVIEPYLQEVAIAAVNGPDSVVISGKRETIRLVVAQLEAMGIKTTPLQVSHAFHSPLIEPMLEEFALVASEITYSPPKIDLISNVTGELVSAQVATPEYWCRHVRCPVQFAAGMEALYRAGYEVFVECGPKPIMLGMGLKCLPEGVGRWLPSLHPGQSDWQQILQSLAQLYVEGVQVDWSGFDQDYERRKVALPTYPFQRQRYWIETAQKPSIQNKQSQIQHAVNPSYWLQQVDSTMNGDSAVNENKLGAKMDASVTTNRRDEIAASLQTLVGNLIEVSPAEVNIDSSFLEMGADSIILVEAVRRIENTYGIKIVIRQLFEELTTINTLATYINQNLSQQGISPDFRQSNPQVQSQQLEQPISTQSIPELSLHNTQNFEHRGIVSAETTLERIMTQQLQVMSQQSQIISELMSQQLEVLRGNGSSSKSLLSQNEQLQSTQTITPAVDSSQKEQHNQIFQATPSSTPAKSELRQPSHQPFSALSSVPSADIQGKELNRRQQHHLQILSTRYNKRHQKSRQLAQTYRPVLADSRATAGFRLSIKEMLYPIAGERAQGSRFWDVDGNEYVDLTMGFGVLLFGHAPQFVTEAVEKHYQQGLKIGPQSKLAGEVAQLICELTGMERVTFCNSGTEAVMTALRLARSATGRTKIALFAGSYHGQFDGILATAAEGEIKAVPSASGVSQNFVENVLVLDYGNPKSIEILQVHAQELAAVLVEPVQSRRPDLQPKELLQQLRQLTQASGTALIFDEILTGFRIHPGGAQTWFDIEADIATYGKIIGGGTPIGVVAGKAAYMNGIDGGLWNYGDASYPQAEKIFFAGTFNKNHTGMVAALAVLQHLKKQGPALQQQLNQRTSQLAQILNSYFEEEDVPIRVVHFGSMFRFAFPGNLDLLFYHLLDKGVYIWEGRTCYLSTAHTDTDINHVIQAVKDSVKELREGGFLPSASSKLLKTDKNTNETSNDLTPAFSDKNFTPSALSSDTQQTIDAEASKELTRLRVSQDECPLRDYMPTASEIGDRLLSEFAQVTCQQNIKVYGEAVAQLEALSITYVLRAFQQMGWEFQPSERFSTKFIVEQLSIIEQHQRLLKRLLEMLVEEKVLRQVDDDCWEATQVVEIQNPQAQEIAFLAQYPEAEVELTLLQRCGQKLAQVLQGECHPLELLFPKGNLTALTKLYQDSPQFQVMNTLVQKAVSGVLERLPHKCRVRILEIGGGTGATTSYILPQLLDHQAEYVFTDLSPVLISKAKKKFGDYPFVCCQILDIEQDPETQAYDFGQYDLIIAANVLHATKDLRQTLKHIQQLLVPGGLLLLVEVTVRQRWLDLTFGLTEGWWKFSDRDLRPSHPLLSTAQWQELLSESGFREVALIPSQEQLSVLSQQAVIVAELARKVSLSEAQKQLGILAQISEDGSLAYNVSISLELRGSFQLAAMRKAVQTVVNRHEALRTIISSQNDFQEILPSLTVDVALVDFSNARDACGGLRLHERELQVADWLKKESLEAFDLFNGPLLRFSILKLEDKIHLLVLTFHHIVVDGWSLGVILQELGALYSAECQGVVCQLEPPMQFKEYIEWQEKQSQTEAMAAHESYWLEQFAQSIPVLDLPTDRPRPPLKTYKGSRQTRRLDVSLTREVKRFSTENGCTLLMTLLSVYTTLLHRLTGQNDIIVGMPTAGRSLEGSEKLVGYCTHILPVRSCLVGSESFLEYLKTLKNRLLEIYEHQDYPFARLIDKLNVARDASRSPLVSAIFNWDRTVAVPKMFELATDLFPKPISCTPFDISLNVMEVDGKLVLDCDYNTDLYDASTIERWLGHFQTLLEGVVANPQQYIAKLPLLTEAERHQLLVEWNNTQTEYPQDKCIHQLFEEQVERSPSSVAVVFEGEQLTYQQLNARANRIAHYLQSLGVGPEVLVGICVERSLEMVVGLLGILKAGGAYVPLDPTYPSERLGYMLEDSSVPVLLTFARLVEALPKHKARVLCLDTDALSFAQQTQSNPESGVMPENLAYVIYTSGSTGKPKGAMNTHRGICNRLLWMQDTYQLTQADRVLQKTPFSFDVSVWEFFWPLLTGARLVVAKPDGHRDPGYLVKVIVLSGITTLHFVPSMLQIFLEEQDIESCSCLRRVICSGEALSKKLLERFFARLECELHNLYGPTEAAIDVTFFSCKRDSNHQTVPIGRPIANTQIYILDHYLQPVGVGVAGELYIGGDGVARGYLNRPDLTAEKFIPNPWSNEPSSRLYKTSDLARYLPDGNIEFLGRIDNQVKIRGFRIELGEIEAAIALYPGVRETVVVVRDDIPGDKRLVAYIVPIQVPPTYRELRHFLLQKLPDYMVPNAIVVLSTMPLTPNGKVDRRALPAPDSSPSDSRGFVPPRDTVEQQLQRIWSEVLQHSTIGVHDNFFELGGHSLLAVRLMARLEQHFGLNLPLATLLATPTIEQLASSLRASPDSFSWSPLVAIQSSGDKKPFFCVPGVGGNVIYFYELARHLGFDQPFYGFSAKGLDGESEPFTRVEDIAAYYIEAMQTLQPRGPYLLGGHSFGGVVAFEMAIQLQKQGQEVALVAIIDALAPIVGNKPNCSDEEEAANLFDFASYIEYMFSLNLEVSKETLADLTASEQLHYLKERLIRVNLLPPDAGITLVRGLVQVYMASLKAHRAYLPKEVFPTRIALLSAQDIDEREGDIEEHLMMLKEPTLGWKEMSGTVDVHMVPRNHMTMMHLPQVQVLAEQLKATLEQAQTHLAGL